MSDKLSSSMAGGVTKGSRFQTSGKVLMQVEDVNGGGMTQIMTLRGSSYAGDGEGKARC